MKQADFEIIIIANLKKRITDPVRSFNDILTAYHSNITSVSYQFCRLFSSSLEVPLPLCEKLLKLNKKCSADIIDALNQEQGILPKNCLFAKALSAFFSIFPEDVQKLKPAIRQNLTISFSWVEIETHKQIKTFFSLKSLKIALRGFNLSEYWVKNFAPLLAKLSHSEINFLIHQLISLTKEKFINSAWGNELYTTFQPSSACILLALIAKQELSSPNKNLLQKTLLSLSHHERYEAREPAMKALDDLKLSPPKLQLTTNPRIQQSLTAKQPLEKIKNQNDRDNINDAFSLLGETSVAEEMLIQLGSENNNTNDIIIRRLIRIEESSYSYLKYCHGTCRVLAAIIKPGTPDYQNELMDLLLKKYSDKTLLSMTKFLENRMQHLFPLLSTNNKEIIFNLLYETLNLHYGYDDDNYINIDNTALIIAGHILPELNINQKIALARAILASLDWNEPLTSLPLLAEIRSHIQGYELLPKLIQDVNPEVFVPGVVQIIMGYDRN